ncbi:MAG: ThuA domain-containing protein [Akkermansiaceae bacterium]|nr:ThuA domain-containing protein [Akkermansiaceae bacterium]
MRFVILSSFLALFSSSRLPAGEPLRFEGGDGPGKGKHIVLIAGDEEYRSEESMPMLARILAERHGFDCSVLFSLAKDGAIAPNNGTSLSAPQALDSADAVVMLIRFRKWPDDAMAAFDRAMKRGVPVVALRTSTHAFQLPKDSAFASYNQFGKEILGEKWVSHWGKHKHEATRGVIEEKHADHPVLRGVSDIFGDSDVYEAAPPEDASILLRGRVLAGMEPDSPPASYSKKRADGTIQDVNDPMMPIAWTRENRQGSERPRKVLCTTMGAATDLENEDLRRLVVNGVFWALELDVPAKAAVAPVGPFLALPYGFNTFRKNIRPEEHTK